VGVAYSNKFKITTCYFATNAPQSITLRYGICILGSF